MRIRTNVIDRTEKIKAQEKLRQELEQQIRNKKLKKELEKVQDVYYGLSVLDSHEPQNLWARNPQKTTANLRQSLPSNINDYYGIGSQKMTSTPRIYQSKTRFNNHNNELDNQQNNFEPDQQNPLQKSYNQNQSHFQKTGNSILQANNLHQNNSDIFDEAENHKNMNQFLGVQNQNDTSNNFVGKSIEESNRNINANNNQEFDFQQNDPNQLISENLDYLYHESDNDMNRQANKYYNSHEDSLKPIMGLVEDPGMTEELLRLRKYQKHQAQSRALLDQIEEKRLKKEWERQQKKLQDNQEYLLSLGENYNNEESNSMNNVLQSQAFDMLHSKGLDKKNVRFEGQKKNPMEELQKEILKQSVDDLTKKFRVEVDNLKDSMSDKNTQIISEMQKLKDKTIRYGMEKDELNMEMSLINRDLMNQHTENEDNMRYLYMALSKTNPMEAPVKKKGSEYHKYVPLNLVDGSSDYIGQKWDPYWRMDELKWDSYNDNMQNYNVNHGTDYEILRINRENKKRLNKFEKLDGVDTAFLRKDDQLNKALEEFYFDEKIKGNGHESR